MPLIPECTSFLYWVQRSSSGCFPSQRCHGGCCLEPGLHHSAIPSLTTPRHQSEKWSRLATQPSCFSKTRAVCSRHSIFLMASSLLPTHSPKCSFLLQAQGPFISCLGLTKMQNNCIALLSSQVPINSLPRESHLSLEFYQSLDCSVFYLVSLIHIYTESILQTIYIIIMLN